MVASLREGGGVVGWLIAATRDARRDRWRVRARSREKTSCRALHQSSSASKQKLQFGARVAFDMIAVANQRQCSGAHFVVFANDRLFGEFFASKSFPVGGGPFEK